MYIQEVEISGWEPYRKLQRIEFTKGIISLKGDNGAGKTSLMKAIDWVLCRTESPMMVPLRKHPDHEIKVVVTLRSDNGRSKYMFRRKCTARGTHLFYMNTYKLSFEAYRALLFSLSFNKESLYLAINHSDLDRMISSTPEEVLDILFNMSGLSTTLFQRPMLERELIESNQNPESQVNVAVEKLFNEEDFLNTFERMLNTLPVQSMEKEMLTNTQEDPRMGDATADIVNGELLTSSFPLNPAEIMGIHLQSLPSKFQPYAILFFVSIVLRQKVQGYYGTVYDYAKDTEPFRAFYRLGRKKMFYHIVANEEVVGDVQDAVAEMMKVVPLGQLHVDFFVLSDLKEGRIHQINIDCQTFNGDHRSHLKQLTDFLTQRPSLKTLFSMLFGYRAVSTNLKDICDFTRERGIPSVSMDGVYLVESEGVIEETVPNEYWEMFQRCYDIGNVLANKINILELNNVNSNAVVSTREQTHREFSTALLRDITARSRANTHANQHIDELENEDEFNEEDDSDPTLRSFTEDDWNDTVLLELGDKGMSKRDIYNKIMKIREELIKGESLDKFKNVLIELRNDISEKLVLIHNKVESEWGCPVDRETYNEAKIQVTRILSQHETLMRIEEDAKVLRVECGTAHKETWVRSLKKEFLTKLKKEFDRMLPLILGQEGYLDLTCDEYDNCIKADIKTTYRTLVTRKSMFSDKGRKRRAQEGEESDASSQGETSSAIRRALSVGDESVPIAARVNSSRGSSSGESARGGSSSSGSAGKESASGDSAGNASAGNESAANASSSGSSSSGSSSSGSSSSGSSSSGSSGSESAGNESAGNESAGNEGPANASSSGSSSSGSSSSGSSSSGSSGSESAGNESAGNESAANASSSGSSSSGSSSSGSSSSGSSSSGSSGSETAESIVVIENVANESIGSQSAESAVMVENVESDSDGNECDVSVPYIPATTNTAPEKDLNIRAGHEDLDNTIAHGNFNINVNTNNNVNDFNNNSNFNFNFNDTSNGNDHADENTDTNGNRIPRPSKIPTLDEIEEEQSKLVMEEFVSSYEILSYAQRKTACLCLILASQSIDNKKIFLMDEIDRNLDPILRGNLARHMRWMCETYDHQYVVISHYPELQNAGDRRMYIQATPEGTVIESLDEEENM